MRRFAYRTPGWIFDQGPVMAADLETAKVEIRKQLGVRRLPHGIQVWDTADRPMKRYRLAQDVMEPVPLFA